MTDKLEPEVVLNNDPVPPTTTHDDGGGSENGKTITRALLVLLLILIILSCISGLISAAIFTWLLTKMGATRFFFGLPLFPSLFIITSVYSFIKFWKMPIGKNQNGKK